MSSDRYLFSTSVLKGLIGPAGVPGPAGPKGDSVSICVCVRVCIAQASCDWWQCDVTVVCSVRPILMDLLPSSNLVDSYIE